MVNEARSSDPVDPLGGYSVLSLLSRTFGASTNNAPPPSDLETDLVSLHKHLRSMALRSPNKLLEQAKTVLDSSSELLNTEIPSNVGTKYENEVVAATGKENLRERRPGLGRKRARFSMKPNTSQSTVDLEPTLDISKLKDPEEFFKAFERLENAKRELQRQRGGVLTDLNQNNPSPPARCRRPGILGPNRRLVKYRHLYPSVPSENNETIISSQETVEEGILRPSAHSLQQETIILDVASQEGELAGSVGKAENKLYDILDELLSANEEDLDGDGAVNLLQERLQIKPMNFEKLCLPDFQDIRRNDLKASGGKLPKPKNTLSDIHNLLQEISSRSPVNHRQEAESSSHLPPPPKSPFASLSMLKRRIFRSSPSNDPYSALNVDESPARNSSPVECYNKVYDPADQRKELSISGKLKSLILEEDDNAVARMGSVEVGTVDSAPPFKESMDVNSTRVGSGICGGPSGSYGDLEDNNGGSNVDEDSSRPDAETDIQTTEPNEMDDKVEDMLQEAVAFAQPDLNMEDLPVDNLESSSRQWDQSSPAAVEDHAVEGQSKIPEIGPEKHVENIQEPSRESLDEKEPSRALLDEQSKNILRPRKERKRKDRSLRKSLADQSNPAAVEGHAMSRRSKIPNIGPEQHVEERSRASLDKQEPSRALLDEQSKNRLCPGKERKRRDLSLRKSLAGAGTSWESGVRRSTRIRTKPLEYWKGERFLYGRIHESLATVIGLKYESPGKGDVKPTMKVKSFVSDEYKELVELVALH